MKAKRSGKDTTRRPTLHAEMSLADFKAYYWMRADLAGFARQLGLATHGYKPDLSARIERRLRGMPDAPAQGHTKAKGTRDSDRQLRRNTRVINYKSDDKTREFFRSQIGPDFHFTYYLNQHRLAHRNLTYGDLADEWVAERDRRRSGDYQPPTAEHGKYNRYIRDFFADEENKGRSLRDAAASWNAIKNGRGDHRYRPRKLRVSRGEGKHR